jgi:2-polyprenyl-3-methyl-5-hydroxy-6-metoxy-1,4-benzoquinol methylase
MPVTREEVVWGYRLLLGREPENAAVVDNYSQVADLATLRQIFINCDEYRARNGDVATIGRYSDIRSVPVEATASAADTQKMMDRIAGEWRHFGETEPHWSVLVDQSFTAANIAENIDRFYATGHLDLRHVFNPMARSGLAAERFGKVLDFGCGVGRLSLALAEHADQVLGVDISPPHIRLARERAAQSGITNVDFKAIDAPGDLDDLRDFDLIVSLIVLQHNPPPVMAAILAKLLAALAPGGVAVLQIPTFMHNYRFAVADYLANAQPNMEMNALPQPAVFEIIDQAGCRMLEVREDNWIGGIAGISQTFAIIRPRKA